MNIPGKSAEDLAKEAEEKLQVEKEALEELKKLEEVCLKEKTVFDASSKSPSDWDIIPEGDGIHALNNRTGLHFIGSVADFNLALRS